MKDLVIFTDLDGTLLDSRYSFEKAGSALKLLKKRAIPLVLCSSKTRAEIEHYRKKLGNRHPFISENGGGVFIPKGYFKIPRGLKTKKRGNYIVVEIGTPYNKLRGALKRIENRAKTRIIGFSDMTLQYLSKESGLSLKETRMAKEREYDEAFEILDPEKEGEIQKLIKDSGLNYTRGGRYWHIMGENDKGRAVRILKKLYRDKFRDVAFVGIGDSKNDEPMLANTGIKILVQREDKTFLKTKLRGVKRVKGIGPLGWNRAIKSLLK